LSVRIRSTLTRGGEPGRRAAQEAGAPGVAFIGQGFDVGQPGMVVHGDVQEVVAQTVAVDLAAADFFAARERLSPERPGHCPGASR
jgi:hypothetical protein